MRPVDKTPFRALNFEDYDAARRHLVEVLGGYCSYCEAPISVDIPVEHKAAKSVREAKRYAVGGYTFAGEESGFPEQQNEWRNLLLACDACNSAKGARPNRADARRYLDQAGENYRSPTPEALYLGALQSSVWPDSTPGVRQGRNWQPALPGDQTYQLFSYERMFASQVELADLGFLRALSPGDRQKLWATTPYSMVWVLPNQSYINRQPDSGLLMSRVQTTLQILQLNRFYYGDPRASDRRTANRTRCYEMAARSLSDLASVLEAGQDPYPLLVPAIRQVALAAGFWSVWMRVFLSAFESDVAPWNLLYPGVKAELLGALFLQYFEWERAPGSSLLIFPGTDRSRVEIGL